MSRINTNIGSLTAQHSLNRTSSQLNTTLQRLSSGLRINSGKDDPAGLIASETLRSEQVAIRQSIKNSERANNIISTADSALGEVSTLLNDVRALVQASQNKGALSASEIAANQVQLDSALDSISRIGQSTVFGGEKLLNGNKAFAVNATGGSLGAFNSTADVTINSFDPSLHSSTAGDDVTLAISAAATKKSIAVVGQDGTVGNNTSLNDLTTNSTRRVTTLAGNDFTIGNTASLNDLTTNSTRRVTTLAGNDFAIGNTASLNDLTTNSTRASRIVAHAASGGADFQDLTGSGANTVTFSVTGDLGTATGIAVNVAAAKADINVLVTAINAQSANTGVVADTSSGDLRLRSSFVGTSAAVSITATAASVGGDVAAFNAAVGTLTAGTTGAATAATFSITGDLGSANVVLANTDTLINHTSANLDAFVAQINGVSSSTGVVASRSGRDILLTSSFVGTGALASATVSGANSALVAAGGTQSSVAGTTGAATTAAFTVTGNKGAAVVNLANTDTLINHTSANLDAFVAQINGVTGTTGVTAARSGNNVVLTSGNVGSGGIATITEGGANAGVVAAAGTNTTVAGTTGTSNTTTLEIIGDLGRSVISVANDSVINNSTALVNAINAVSSQTGVTASTTGTAGANVTLTSSKYGSAAVASLNAIAATNAADITTYNAAGTQSSTAGTNAVGTVTHSKGSGAFTANGEVINYNDSFLNLTAVSSPGLGNLTSNFDVTGGALFQLGPQVNFANQLNVNITGLDLATLGRNLTTTGAKALSALKTGGSDQLSNSDLSTAASVVDQAISQVATLRGRLGALQKNVLESNIKSLNSSLEQVSAAESAIRDADFAEETAALTRNQILTQAGTSVLALANQSPQSVLSLLQR